MSTYLLGYYNQLGLLEITPAIVLFTVFWVASIVISSKLFLNTFINI